MGSPRRFCEQCGTPLKTGVRFCELCGVPWRTLIDRYDWHSPIWAAFYDTPPGELLSADRGNGAIPLSEVIAATVILDEELDNLDIELAGGTVFHFQLFNQVGRPAARFLAQVLDTSRVRLLAPAAR